MSVGFTTEQPHQSGEDVVSRVLNESFPFREGPIFLTDDIADETLQFLDETEMAMRFEIARMEEVCRVLDEAAKAGGYFTESGESDETS